MPQFDCITDWFEWLNQSKPTGKQNLHTMKVIAQSLDLDRTKAKVITVTGTNGKGSFVETITAMLHAQGYKTGCYTSPHLFKYNERIRVNLSEVDDEELLDAFNVIAQSASHHGLLLHFFELLTLAALIIFQKQPLDYLILEVGLGGRLDPVNVLSPDIGVITSIGLDHAEYLGNNRESIAREKCGILRPHTVLLNIEPAPPDALNKALSTHTHMSLGTDFSISYSDNWILKDYKDGTNITLPSNGLSPFSMGAAIIAAKHIINLPFAPTTLNTLLSALSLPGRFQVLQFNGIRLILDVAHNVQAMTLLSERLKERPLEPGRKRIAVFSLLQDKDLDGITNVLLKDFDAWFLGELKTPRAYSPSLIAEKLHEKGVHMISVSKNMRQALARALSLVNPGDEVIILGSFTLIAEVYPKLKKYME